MISWCLNPMSIFPSHVALLVPSVRRAADYLKRFGFEMSSEEIWDGEGTKEIYFEKEKANSLLLMEPFKPGAYQRAMEKRGPGLHHLAVDALDVDTFISSVAESGWLLHPISEKTLEKTRTIYLFRPGFPALIEVQERKELGEDPLFVTDIALPFSSDLNPLVKHIGLEKIVRASTGPATLTMAGKTVEMKNLFS